MLAGMPQALPIASFVSMNVRFILVPTTICQTEHRAACSCSGMGARAACDWGRGWRKRIKEKICVSWHREALVSETIIVLTRGGRVVPVTQH